MQTTFRLDPAMPVTAYKTYQVAAPLATHYRTARCEEVDCGQQANGWASPIDESTDLGKQQAWYIRNQSGRRYRENRNLLPGLTVFEFEPGQQCFAEHHVPLDRPALYVVRDGDWRGNPTGRTARRRPDDWVDDFATHQDKLKTELEKG
jgi:hypothetical protein